MTSFQKDSLGWQIELWLRKISQWWEFQTYRVVDNLPEDINFPWHDSVYWIAAGLLFSYIAFKFWQWLQPYLGRFNLKLTPAVTPKPKQASTQASIAKWLRRSQQYQQQGNYREACLCLYQAMLQHLNDSSVAPHQTSRTDGEYRAIIKSLAQPQPYQILLHIHEQLSFGYREASLSVLQKCQQAYQEIEARR